MITVLSINGEVVLPDSIRNDLKLVPGIKFICEIRDDSIVLTPERPRPLLGKSVRKYVTDPLTALRVRKAASGRAPVTSEMISKMTEFDDLPKLLANDHARAERLSQLQDDHVKPLSDFVDFLRNEVGEGASIPDFDPWDGGVNAEILFLLEAPGAKAVRSGFISRNNPDESAKNFFELTAEAGIPRKRSVIWNIVPWYIGDDSRIRPANSSDIASGSSSLSRLLDLLPHLRIVVLVGRKAERAERIIWQSKPKVRIFKAPHPSPLFVNNAPGNRERLLEALRKVADFLHDEGG
jgi:uracil-DNA glycosylase/bifunctional DNA-binding transcriptional regulator/antitoxin component of YhaV-PrlF toxin-antitoxin module